MVKCLSLREIPFQITVQIKTISPLLNIAFAFLTGLQNVAGCNTQELLIPNYTVSEY